jgi:DMSO/TMAO reductase YedYZ molybdopterin-dependent catalytic subunit
MKLNKNIQMERHMKKRLLFLFVLFFVTTPLRGIAEDQHDLSIRGAVKHPLNLSLGDLEEYQSTRVQLNEIMKDGQYNGVFYYRGVPLRTILESASIEKKVSAFTKRTDIAVVVRNSKGLQATLSWGEIFYRNPGRYILATSAIPIMPHGDCSSCHGPDEYRPRLERLHRKIDFPKLVIAGDVYSDRSLDGVIGIQVLDLRPQAKSKKGEPLFSPELSIKGETGAPLTFRDLSSFPRESAIYRHVGEGRGFHGINRIEGISLKSVLEKKGIEDDLNQVFLVSAPDGYNSLFSYGEIFLDPAGERVMIVDKIDGQALEEGGKFRVIPPDDAMADRTVKAAQEIEVIRVQ